MFEHYLLDNPLVPQDTNSGKAHDPDYHDPQECYYDPEFSEEWDRLGEDTEGHDEESILPVKQENTPDIYNLEEWEEV